jgi:hypothetical protein
MYRHKMNSTQCSTNRLRSGCGGTESERKGMLAYRGAVLLRRPPKIEQEEDLLLPKRKIQLKENDDSHLQFYIAADGRLLMSDESIDAAQMVASPANSPEREVSALGYATYGALSADGKSIVFGESGKAASARLLLGNGGSPRVKRNFSRHATSMWFSHSLRSWHAWHYRTRSSSMACCSRPVPKHFSKSLAIRDTSERKLVSSASCTPGIRGSAFTLMFIALFPLAG